MNSIKVAPAVILSSNSGGLGAVRSLARRRVPVTVIAFYADDPALWSRYPSRKVTVPGETLEEKKSHILRILDELPSEGAALLTAGDELVSWISDHRSTLHEKYYFELPPKKVLDALNNKAEEVDLLQSLGFKVPKTITQLPEDPATLQEELGFPIIFKPYSFAEKEFFPLKNAIVRGPAELNEFYLRWRDTLVHLLAQEVIIGSDRLSWVCSCTFDKDHHILDCGIKQKIRGFPPHFGGSTFAVSKDNPDVLGLAKSIGMSLKYVGHAGLEFRWDDQDKCYKYIELNPRFPANVGFDEDCGLSTVWNSYLVALGRTPENTSARQKQGIYFIDLTVDIETLREDKAPLHKIFAALVSLPFRKSSGLYFSWDDPIPGLVIGYRFLRRIPRKLARELRAVLGALRHS